MRKLLLLILLTTFSALSSVAQTPRQSRHFNVRTGRMEYRDNSPQDYYVGLRLGAAFTSISSSKLSQKASGKTGINVGVLYGTRLTDVSPLYLEGGLMFVEKGGKNTTSGVDYDYNLNYLEVPFVVKYIYDLDRNWSLQPLFGGFIAFGVGGQIKNYSDRTTMASFSSNDRAFRSFDGGLRMGVGAAYNALYAELAYDLGLANISHDSFEGAKTHNIMLTVGVNF